LRAAVLRQEPIQSLPTTFDVFSYLGGDVHHLAVAAFSDSQVSRKNHCKLAIALRSALSDPLEERCCQFAVHNTINVVRKTFNDKVTLGALAIEVSANGNHTKSLVLVKFPAANAWEAL
jgi:hypothetical protein